MNRRHFLSLARSALALAPRGLRPAESPRRIRAGFLGVSYSHAPGKLKVLQESGDYEVVGTSEESEKVREQFAKTGLRFLPEAELLRECDVMVIESAVRDHARHAKLVLEAGKHAHVEKPPADSRKQFEEIVALARRKNGCCRSVTCGGSIPDWSRPSKRPGKAGWAACICFARP